MAFVDITSDQHALYGTHTHAEEGFATRGATYPGQLRWSDLHPPGVKVLPKGSPPAGPGEINWEDTLGGKFALAVEKLEGLLYAVFGSRPHAHWNGSSWVKRQWYDRQHPRCLWGPEMWERRLLMGPIGCHEEGQCWDYQEDGKEYAALGDDPPCCAMPHPTVPIRSRSGDPNGAFGTGTHDRTYFPIGNVSRDFSSEPFDPEGYGWFGATQPGRQDGVGYEHRDGQAVTFRWTRPAGVPTPTTIQLWWKRRLPGGFWSGWDAMTMTPSGDTYSATFEAQPHGTEFRWYIRYFYDDPNPQNPDITKYDPGDDTAPTDEQAYYLQWFTHFNPYIYGLPEMLETYGGVNVRHGTDFYQFDGGETIQPELINMCRWILSWLGGDCCGGEFDTCAETDDRSDVFHHNPRFRGGDEGLCCIPMPIRFRWSGSNVHPHYVTGGKGLVGGSTPDPRPLHNHPNHKPPVGDAWGSAAARKTWRGINMLYTDDAHFDNPFYGGGYSWGTAPGTFILMYKPNWEELAQVWAKYPSWGLRACDVIEAVHIKEIVDAVDYLIDYGVWSTIPICTRKRTPGQFMGRDCGYHYATNYTDCFGTSGAEWRVGCQKCCANGDACWPYDHVLGFWYHEWGPGYENEYTEFPDTCEPWPTPTWEECTQNCGSAKCHMMSRKSGYSQYSPESSPDCPCERGYWEDTVCDGYDAFGPYGGYEASPGCGYHRNEQGCRSWDWKSESCVDDPHAGYNCVRRVEGLSYFACTPGPCYAGWDANHGGLFKKNRLDHEWCHDGNCGGLYFKATGPPGNEFSGNCLGDMFGCGTIYPLGPDQGLWFYEVTGIYWQGLVPSWYPGCSGMPGCSSDCSFGDTLALPPQIPGYGYHGASSEPLCEQYVDSQSGCFSAWAGSACCTGHICQCSLGNFPACEGEAAWVAVDLNLDGSGRPYRNFPGRNGDLPPYTGRGIPRLRDYDLTKDPATWMHDCPCETWTGAGQCVI